jgi:hypothetical protein
MVTKLFRVHSKNQRCRSDTRKSASFCPIWIRTIPDGNRSGSDLLRLTYQWDKILDCLKFLTNTTSEVWKYDTRTNTSDTCDTWHTGKIKPSMWTFTLGSGFISNWPHWDPDWQRNLLDPQRCKILSIRQQWAVCTNNCGVVSKARWMEQNRPQHYTQAPAG